MLEKFVLSKAFMGLILVCLVASAGFAQTTTFTYQGKLTDTGTPQAIYQMQFRLFGSPGGNDQFGVAVTNNNVSVNQGVFTTNLDFLESVFSGSDRFLEISVRRSTIESFVTLNPRQQITSSPYSIRTLSAAQADVALNSQQLGGVNASEYVTTTSVGNSFIRNSISLQTANFNVSGNGAVGGTLGIGTPAPSAYGHGGTNKIVEIQNSATGINSQAHSILSTGSTSGGTSVGSVTWAVPNTTGAEKRAAMVASGLEGSAASSVTSHLSFWTTNAGAVGERMKITPQGNITQPVAANGLVKAMIYVNGFAPSITRCYNGITNSSTGNCGFSVVRHQIGSYTINFGFQVNDRFLSVTPSSVGLSVSSGSFEPNAAFVGIYDPTDSEYADSQFYIIVY